jgi:hypothetical protein
MTRWLWMMCPPLQLFANGKTTSDEPDHPCPSPHHSAQLGFAAGRFCHRVCHFGAHLTNRIDNASTSTSAN